MSAEETAAAPVDGEGEDKRKFNSLYSYIWSLWATFVKFLQLW